MGRTPLSLGRSRTNEYPSVRCFKSSSASSYLIRLLDSEGMEISILPGLYAGKLLRPYGRVEAGIECPSHPA